MLLKALCLRAKCSCVVSLRMCTCACGYDNDGTTLSLLYSEACLLAALRCLVPAGSLECLVSLNTISITHKWPCAASSVLGLIGWRQPNLCVCATGGVSAFFGPQQTQQFHYHNVALSHTLICHVCIVWERMLTDFSEHYRGSLVDRCTIGQSAANAS